MKVLPMRQQARNQDFAKGEGVELNVKVFFSYTRRADQTGVNHKYHK